MTIQEIFTPEVIEKLGYKNYKLLSCDERIQAGDLWCAFSPKGNIQFVKVSYIYIRDKPADIHKIVIRRISFEPTFIPDTQFDVE